MKTNWFDSPGPLVELNTNPHLVPGTPGNAKERSHDKNRTSHRALHPRLSECPSEFLENQILDLNAFVKAVLFDLLQDLHSSPDPEVLEGWLTFAPKLSPKKKEKALRLYLIASWVLFDPFFRDEGVPFSAVGTLLREKLLPLAEVLDPLTFVEESDRREELSRLILSHLSYLPHGEKAEFAADRLASLDSIERHALILDARKKAKHAEKVRKKIAEEEARAAAARWNRE